MPGIVTAVQDWASTISSRYHPICKQSACRPLAPSVTCGDSSLPEGAMGCCVSTLDLWELEVPAVNPSVTAKATGGSPAVPAPFGKGAFLCPVSLLRCRIGHRQSPAGTTPSANNQLVARWLPQSPAVTAPSRRELWAAAFPHWICGNWKCQL